MAERTFPADAHWWAHAIIGANVPYGTETFELDAYFDDSEEPTSSDFLIPDDWEILEFTVYATKLNPEYVNDEMKDEV